MPFDGNSAPEVYRKICKGVFSMPFTISKECQDFLKKMITVNPTERLTAMQALNHKWIKDNIESPSEADDAELNKTIVKNLRKYKGESILKKAAMNVLVKHLTEAQVEQLRKEF